MGNKTKIIQKKSLIWKKLYIFQIQQLQKKIMILIFNLKGLARNKVIILVIKKNELIFLYL